jgi:predicted alpha/beta-fold hydrolase
MNFIRHVSTRKTHMGSKLNNVCVEQINRAPDSLAETNQLKTDDPVSMAWLLFRTALVLLLLFGGGCAALNSNSEADIASTWTQARVYLPRVPSYVRPADVSVVQKLPTVVLLHGCTGLSPGIARWARTLSSAGYGVVTPDSFARSYRWSNCDPKTYLGGAFPESRRMRQEEIEYALKSLRTVPWADERNLFLMGHSEGGGAVALWQGGGFRAQIISGNRCRQGLLAPPTIPVIVIGFVHDPWDGNYRRTCAIRFGGRESASELLLPGSGHDTSQSPEAQRAVLDFLRAHTSHERN